MAERRVIASFSIIGLIIPFLAVFLFVFGPGIGVGYLLRKICGIDLGIAILIGVIGTSVCLHFSSRLIGAIQRVEDEDEDEEDEEYYVPPPRRGRRRRR
jgi:hypothetical protein